MVSEPLPEKQVTVRKKKMAWEPQEGKSSLFCAPESFVKMLLVITAKFCSILIFITNCMASSFSRIISPFCVSTSLLHRLPTRHHWHRSRIISYEFRRISSGFIQREGWGKKETDWKRHYSPHWKDWSSASVYTDTHADAHTHRHTHTSFPATLEAIESLLCWWQSCVWEWGWRPGNRPKTKRQNTKKLFS